MRALKKTVILPSDQKALALSMFRQWVYEEPYVLFVALGKGPEAETTVARADALTGSADDNRWVVWARKPEHIKEALEELVTGDQTAAELAASRGFSLSMSDQVRDTIAAGEPVPDLVRLFLAYARAEQAEESP